MVRACLDPGARTTGIALYLQHRLCIRLGPPGLGCGQFRDQPVAHSLQGRHLRVRPFSLRATDRHFNGRQFMVIDALHTELVGFAQRPPAATLAIGFVGQAWVHFLQGKEHALGCAFVHAELR